MEAATLSQQRLSLDRRVIKPAGFEASQNIISSAYLKDTSDPQWKDDAGMKAFDEFLDQVLP